VPMITQGDVMKSIAWLKRQWDAYLVRRMARSVARNELQDAKSQDELERARAGIKTPPNAGF
jgi:hypothetical protein